jgi:hypothetical protein
MNIRFLVQGSAATPYEVEFVKRSETNISAYCTCPAGQNGMYCKHRFSIIEGKTKGIVSDNLEDVQTVKSWLSGSDIEAAIERVLVVEGEVAKVKKRLSLAKKELAKAMRE